MKGAYYDYAIRQLDIEQVAVKYKKERATIWRYFDKFKDITELKELTVKEINLVVDTTYFGRGFGYMVFRAHGINLYYQQVATETVEWLRKGLEYLEASGYKFKSITVDGRKGFIAYIKKRYPAVPVQYCQFHQKQTIQICTTNNPKTQCGLELKAFMKGFMAHNYDSFIKAFAELHERWRESLKERNDKNGFKHKMLRRGFYSLKRNAAYLFTYKAYKIRNTRHTKQL